MIEYQSLSVDGPEDLGDSGARFEGTLHMCVPLLPEGRIAFRYKVPSGKKVTAEALSISLYNGTLANPQAGVVSLGAIKLRQNSADVMEFGLYGNPPPALKAGDETVASGYSANQEFGFGEGLVFTAGQPVEITISPVALYGYNVTATLYGRTAGATDIRYGRLVVSATTANQRVVGFTPASDFTLFSLDCTGDLGGSMVVSGLRVELNGAVLMETGPLGQADSDTTFGSFLPIPGPISIPMFGSVLYEGDEIVVYAHPAWVGSHKVVAQLVGLQEDIASGGGGGGTNIYDTRFHGRGRFLT